MGAHNTVQVGWVHGDYLSDLYKKDIPGNEGAGYVALSTAFDSSRSGMAIQANYVATSGITTDKGTVNCCEGEKWSFDGETKVSTTSLLVPGTVQVSSLGAGEIPSYNYHPGITVKGSFCVTNIVLE
jgi:hypothetical protein